MILLLYAVNVDYIDWFLNTEPTLCPWNKFCLILLYDYLFYVAESCFFNFVSDFVSVFTLMWNCLFIAAIVGDLVSGSDGSFIR